MMMRTFAISLCLAGLGFSGLGQAQTAPAPGTPGNAPRPRGGGPGGPGRGGPGGRGGELFGPNGEARLTKQLGLDATQQNTLHTALLSANVQRQGAKEKMAALRTQLAAAVKTGDEGSIDKATQDIATLNQQESAVHAKTISKIYTSLRPDQKTKFEQQVNREVGLPGQPGQRGPGGRGPRPGRRAPAPAGGAAPAQQ
jgi:Spy/CpxP family protein refolding chaperone